ncbi:MAG TPA: rhodanese-like domain-containing protein [Polyangia bacterium]|nr:rhodanese-like domain-containing protein [Polyangia bacterium]
MLRTVRGVTATTLHTLESLLPAHRLPLRVTKWILRRGAELIAPAVQQVPPSYERMQAAAAAAATAPAPVATAAPPATPTMEAAFLRTALSEREPPLIVDVREPHETALGVIPGARLIPMQSVPTAIGELRGAGRPIVVYCAHGVRSANVVVHLRDRGVDACSLRGGIDAWLSAGGALASPP